MTPVVDSQSNNQIKIKFTPNSYANTGTVMLDTTLEAMLVYCFKKLPINGKKGQYGAVYIYDSNQLGIHDENTTSTGVILIDIDHISKQIADMIYDNFELLCDYFKPLVAIQYSSSYYINPNKNGLHIYVKSERLNENDHKKTAEVALAALVEVIKTALGIDLFEYQKKLQSESEEDIVVLDFHNTSLYQRFVLFYSTFKYNQYATTFSIDGLLREQLELISKKYNISFEKKVKNRIIPTYGNCVIGGNKDNKLCINRYVKVGKYSGNSLRLRISIVAKYHFGDNAKDFCDKYFYYDNNKSIYSCPENITHVNTLVEKWLIDNNYIKEENKKYIKEWISEYSKEIVGEINDNKYLEVIAPTGSGKTTYINEYLAKKLNAVVIVPFNVTNKLYDKLVEVNSTYIKDVPKNKPVVMIWDQAIRRWDEIKDRNLIVDEAHTLFFDRTYRNVAIQLLTYIKEYGCHTTFITATPAGESDILKMKQLYFYKKRDMINISVLSTLNVEWQQYNYIKKCIDNNWYDKIVLLDDTSAKKIYEKFTINGYGNQISYIRSSTKESEDFLRLRDTEILDKKLTICTCIAFNGLNFKNKDEKVLVIGSIRRGNTTACEIIQQIGRIRNSDVKGLYFYNPRKDDTIDINKKVERTQEFHNIVLAGCPDSFISYDRKFLDDKYVLAYREIQKYEESHSSIDTIIDELGKTGYISGTYDDTITSDEIFSMTLALKRKESDELKDDLLNDTFVTNTYDSGYKLEWSKDINFLVSNPLYSGIDIKLFKDLCKTSIRSKSIDTIIKNVRKIIKVCTISENEYNSYFNNVERYANMLSDINDKKKFYHNVKEVQTIRNKYANKIRIVDNCLYLDSIFDDVISFEESNIERQKSKSSEGGKIGGKKTKKIKDLQTGLEYDSVANCAASIGRNITYISKHKDRFIAI